MKDETEDIIKAFLTELVGGMVIVAVMLGLALLFGGCSHKVVEDMQVERVHDTLTIIKEKRDSVVYRDSVFVHLYEKGDTVYSITERWNVQYKDRVRVDTVYKARDRGEILKSVITQKEEKPWWDSIIGALIGAALFVLLLRFVEKKVL